MDMAHSTAPGLPETDFLMGTPIAELPESPYNAVMTGLAQLAYDYSATTIDRVQAYPADGHHSSTSFAFSPYGVQVKGVVAVFLQKDGDRMARIMVRVWASQAGTDIVADHMGPVQAALRERFHPSRAFSIRQSEAGTCLELSIELTPTV